MNSLTILISAILLVVATLSIGHCKADLEYDEMSGEMMKSSQLIKCLRMLGSEFRRTDKQLLGLVCSMLVDEEDKNVGGGGESQHRNRRFFSLNYVQKKPPMAEISEEDRKPFKYGK